MPRPTVKPSKYLGYNLVLTDHKSCKGFPMPTLKNGRVLHYSCSECNLAYTPAERKDGKIWVYTKIQ